MNSSRCMARTAAWLGSCTLLLALAACGGGSNSGNVPEPILPLTPSGGEQPAQTFKAADFAVALVDDLRVFTKDGEEATNWNSRVAKVKTLVLGASTSSAMIDNTKLDGTNGYQEYFTLDHDGLWVSSAPLSTNDHTAAQKLLPAQFKVGDSFVQEDSTFSTNATDANGIPYVLIEHIHADATILSQEDITTHAGLFKDCMHVKATITSTTTTIKNGLSTPSNPFVTTVNTWYASGMGKVRETVDDGFDSTTFAFYAYRIAGKSNEQLRPTATVGSAGLPTSGAFVIRFSEPMQLATLNGDTLQIIDPNGQAVPFTTSTDFSSATSMTITPAASYVPASGTYQFKISEKVTDLAGNGLIPLDQSVDITISPPCCGGGGATVWLWAH